MKEWGLQIERTSLRESTILASFLAESGLGFPRTALQLVTQLQQAHRLAAGFYQRILPLFDQIASQALDAEFWFWEPSETSRPCRSGTRPSSSWAWDYLPLFASNHAYRDWDGDTAQQGDKTLVFRLFLDHDFRRTSSLRAGVKGQPDPLQLNGQAIVEVTLFRCLENSDKHFDEREAAIAQAPPRQ